MESTGRNSKKSKAEPSFNASAETDHKPAQFSKSSSNRDTVMREKCMNHGHLKYYIT